MKTGFKLFDTAKVGLMCDAIAHTTEKRTDGTEAKVIQLTLRVAPFDAKLALALHPDVRNTLFRIGHPDAHPHLARVNFALGVPRQFLELYATPESPKTTMALDHVLITGIYARTQAGMNNLFVLIFKATFGPVSDKELGFCEGWRNTMKFGSFSEAESSDLFVNPGDEPDEDDEDEDAQQALPDPEFETDGKGKPLDGPTYRDGVGVLRCPVCLATHPCGIDHTLPADAPPSTAETRDREQETARAPKPRHASRRDAAKAKQGNGPRSH